MKDSDKDAEKEIRINESYRSKLNLNWCMCRYVAVIVFGHPSQYMNRVKDNDA